MPLRAPATWATIVLLSACTQDPVGHPRPGPTDDDTTPGVDTSTGDTAPVDTALVDTALVDTDTGSTGAGTPIDCSVLPPVPASFHTLEGFSTAEDFDFDGEGYAVSIYDGNLVGKDRYGASKLIASNVSASTSGTRVLPTGDWVVNDVASGAVQRIDLATGAKSVILSGLSYPNGLEVDADNQVYVAEQTGGRVQQVDAYTGATSVVAAGLYQPNGVILSPDGDTLYVGSMGGGMVYAIDRVAPGVWDSPRQVIHTGDALGGFDGINVDLCGNVYITEYTAGVVWRVTPDGEHFDKVVELPSSWIPNLRWGTGEGAWATDVLYVADRNEGRIFGLELGIAGKPHVLAP